MNKKWIRRIFALTMILSLAVGQYSFAEEGEGNIVISGDGVYEIEAGKTTTIDLQVKNKVQYLKSK